MTVALENVDQEIKQQRVHNTHTHVANAEHFQMSSR